MLASRLQAHGQKRQNMLSLLILLPQDTIITFEAMVFLFINGLDFDFLPHYEILGEKKIQIYQECWVYHFSPSSCMQLTNVSLSGSDNSLYCMYHSQQRHIDSRYRALQVVAF